MLQPACNMACSFCVTEDGFDAIRFDQALDLLEELTARGVRSIVLGGGEPLVWPGDLLRLAGEAKSRGFCVQVGTNAIRLPHGFEELDCIDRWVLPLESADPEVHGRMRYRPAGHHALILRRLEALRRVGKSVTLSTVVTAVNAAGVEDLARFLEEYHAHAGNIHAWHLYRFLPLGRGGASNADSLAIPEREYLAACERVTERGLGFRVFRRADMYHSRTVEFFWSEGGVLRSGSEAWARADTGSAPESPR
jgi:MoaA/NifB/PqqE/SkfB family radical SAM enzyme